MGKCMFHEVYASPERTAALNIPELMVVSELDEVDSVANTYHAVQHSYFEKEKLVCPYCKENNTVETKIRPRKFKDILTSAGQKRDVIDLVFHQRYFRCKTCKRVFSESISFAEDGCRYTNRLSDLLADGTLTQTYESVCRKYGVPASKTSVGVIMRRRLRMKVEQLPPLETPEALCIFVPSFYSSAYPIVLGISGENVRLIDVLSESSESAYAIFFSRLDKEKIKHIYIDPDEQLHYAAVAALPNAKVMISEECLMRYARDCLGDVIRQEGTRCFVHQRYYTMCKEERYLTKTERRQVRKTLDRCHRLAAAYEAYQDLLTRMDSAWHTDLISGWVDDLPQYLQEKTGTGEKLEELHEFDVLKDITRIYKPQIDTYIALETKPPAAMTSAVMAINESLKEMPYCIYDILHARMMLNVDHDWEMKNDQKYRIGIPVDRLTRRMNEISRQIRSKKETISYGYESED